MELMYFSHSKWVDLLGYNDGNGFTFKFYIPVSITPNIYLTESEMGLYLSLLSFQLNHQNA